MTQLTVLYGTETGNSELLAMDICKAGENSGLECEHYGMEVIEGRKERGSCDGCYR